VKESNRIKWVVRNLVKCGIFCHETSDGIRIIGRSKEYFKSLGEREIYIEC
jgi:5-enolpyruvylshikimate-3-phosphate synthase